MRTEKEQLEWEMQAYGCTQAQIEEELTRDIIHSPQMYAMSILSDAQEVLEMTNDKETARQFINKAKFIMSKCWGIKTPAMPVEESETDYFVRFFVQTDPAVNNAIYRVLITQRYDTEPALEFIVDSKEGYTVKQYLFNYYSEAELAAFKEKYTKEFIEKDFRVLTAEYLRDHRDAPLDYSEERGQEIFHSDDTLYVKG